MCDTNYFIKNSGEQESQMKQTKWIKKKCKQVE